MVGGSFYPPTPSWIGLTWWDWYLPEDEKKEIEPVFTDYCFQYLINIEYLIIGIFRHRKLCIKMSYSSKFFLFNFLGQNVWKYILENIWNNLALKLYIKTWYSLKCHKIPRILVLYYHV